MIVALVFLSLIAIMLSPLAPDADAQQRPLIHPDGGKAVIIWRSERAHEEGIRLISAGVNKTNPAILMPLIACVPEIGDKVVVVDGGFFSGTVTVVTGKTSGCRGVVSNDYIGREGQGASVRKKDTRGDMYQAPKAFTGTHLKCLNSLTERQWTDRERLCPEGR